MRWDIAEGLEELWRNRIGLLGARREILREKCCLVV